jgi:hypothetical protein
MWGFFPPFFFPSLGQVGCLVRFFLIAFLGVSYQGELKNAIKKNRAKISSAPKKSSEGPATKK